MSALEIDGALPRGFSELTFAGIGLSCRIIEPEKIGKPTDWIKIIGDLESWGEVPDPEKITDLSIFEDERGPNQ